MSQKTQTSGGIGRYWIGGGVALGLAIALLVQLWPVATGPKYNPVRQRAWESIEPRLQDANATEAKIVEQHLASVREFFNDRRSGAAAFADSALSLGGKWAWIKGKITFDNGEGHRAYLREAFEQHMFREEELRAVLNSAVTGMLTDLKGLENALLAQIRADLSDSDLTVGGRMPALQGDEVFFRAYEQAAQNVLNVMAQDLGVALGREVVAWVAADIAAKVIARLGVSAGILGAGVGSGVATFGVGLGAAFLVDMALDWALKKVGHDPVGDVASKVGESLDQTRDALIGGNAAQSGGQKGLRHELTKLCGNQARVRREALRRLILEEGGLQ